MTRWMLEAGDSFKRLFQGAVAGALVMVIVGFAWGGWKLEVPRKSAPDRQLLPLFHRQVSISPAPGTRNRDSSDSPSSLRLRW
jgi:hypothetical protein